MNQILFHSTLPEKEPSSLNAMPKKHNHSTKKIFILVFILSIFFIFLSLFFYGFYLYDRNHSTKIADHLTDTLSISRIYSNTVNYATLPSYHNIIGMIEIDKISIQYPIFSHTTDDLLKIGPCRFYGPLPNQNGNLCIAAHNYDNQKFFSNIHQLKKGDSIKITGLEDNPTFYIVTSVYEVDPSDTSSTKQQFDQKEITLITCNNKNNRRIIVKANEKR